MNLLYHRDCLMHHTGQHPENLRRLEVVADYFDLSGDSQSWDGEAYLSLIHPAEHIEKIKEASRQGRPLDGDTMTSTGSWQAACRAVGLVMAAAENNDFALVRPPGHHAYPRRASGFCLFNNVAIATQYLVNQGLRVAIVDFDGHLGDGTEAIFYDTDQVLFWSLHQHPAFPGGGLAHEIGAGQGQGFTINTPLPPGSGDDIGLDAFTSVLPIIEQFQPDVVAVSAGFDAHIDDPLLQLRFSDFFYYHVGRELAARFPRLFATLEGGYNLETLPYCVASFLAGVNGEDFPFPKQLTNSGLRQWTAYEADLATAMEKLSAYWEVTKEE